MEIGKATTIAESIKQSLKGTCERIEIAGSIRRRKSDVGDIELLCIPLFDDIGDKLDQRLFVLVEMGMLHYRLNKKGATTYGPKNKFMVHSASGIGVDIFSTTAECWPVALVVRTGGKVTNQRISMAALRRGMRFHAYGRGFTEEAGPKEWICKTERDVFQAVGLPYLEPWERE